MNLTRLLIGLAVPILLAACGPFGDRCGGAGINYTPIAGVPAAVNSLGALIAQKQRDVVSPGGDQFQPCYSSADQASFEGSGRLQQIVSDVTGSATFRDGVAAIQTMSEAVQASIYAVFGHPIDPTWSQTGHIGNGTTDAGQAVEREIANALTNAVEAAARPVLPSITVQPADQGVVAPAAASFTIATTGLPTRFQWQVSTDRGVTFSDIAGAASSTYTTPGTTAADDGKRYRVIVGNATGTVTSNAAVLSVGISTSCGSGGFTGMVPPAGGAPAVRLQIPAAGAGQLCGIAYNVDTTQVKVVIWVLTNQWYVQPYTTSPFTSIGADGSWTSTTHPWDHIVVLLVDPASYVPGATRITNPALDPGVIASTEYPSAGPASLAFSGYTWGIKTTGNTPGDRFDPGPNFWSNDPSVVHLAADGLHLKIAKVDGNWQSAEVYLLQSLGYGVYTVRVNAALDHLDRNTVAAPLFTYAAPGQELDFEYGGPGGLIPAPGNAQFVVQPYTVAGNLVRYVQPPAGQFTTQMEWRADHVSFRSWQGWSDAPAPGDMIAQWTYTGAYIPPPGQERVHINLWLLGGNAPASGAGDEMVISSFRFQP